jgi:uncharacterized protein YaeQ
MVGSFHMAPNATLFHFQVDLSDVDRGLYQTLDFRAARHPSESTTYLVSRTLAYCLSYEEGIGFSKAGVSSTDEPPVVVRDPTGRLLAWIDVGSPAAERLHKAAKACGRVAVFTSSDLGVLRRAARSGVVYDAARIEIQTFAAGFIERLEPYFERHAAFGLVRSEGHLYFTTKGASVDGALSSSNLLDADTD